MSPGLEKDYNADEKYAIEFVVQQVKDIFEEFRIIFVMVGSDEEKKAAFEKYKKEKFPAHFEALKKMIAKKYPGVTRGDKMVRERTRAPA